MPTPETAGNTMRNAGDSRHLEAVPDRPDLSIAGVFADFARTHPAMYPPGTLDEALLYGGALDATPTTRLKTILNSLAVSYPPVREFSAAKLINQFERIGMRITSVHGENHSLSEATEDLAMTRSFLVMHELDTSFAALSLVILNLLDIEDKRRSENLPIVGPKHVLALGHTAMYGLDPDGYEKHVRSAIRNKYS